MQQPKPATAGSAGESYYEAREKIYPREVQGRFQRLRNLAVFVLLGIYYVLPWLRWDERQAVLFDLPARKFHIFALTFWPQDFFYLAWLLIIAALTLFLFTSIAGRLWCGYACPQTVWTEVFIWMERWTEGNRQQRMRLDKAPWSANKFWRKAAKQFLWITFAAWTGFTFVGYFTPIAELGGRVATLSLGGWETFWIIFYSFATYGNAGMMREQVCKYMCPYARFQSAMFDRDTLIISYDSERGEQRGKRKRKADPASLGLGDCIDCTMCVQVCPTGIDIREGLQYECIACAACVDVCDSVMDKMGYPRGLVRYSTQHSIEHKASKVIRPRTIVYSLLWLALIAGFVFAIGNRTPLIVDVIRDRNALYREVDAERIENVYTLRILNMDNRDHTFRIEATGIEGIEVDMQDMPIAVNAGEIATLPLRLRVPRSAVGAGGTTIQIRAQAVDNENIDITQSTRFIGPIPSR
ncbi:MAG: cytochrome c oxidase accessory protein CcoG [Chromatiales bacterium]|jgi:cytochrome c oxidase accessory protein FixG|nr:cytochrome c oxidase accessory protein CcoG [Chromatiales bacterium]MDH3945219.1 cytochrome c oxidase accessory protein CcoG [Chromatiales bacterium]MDH4013170.1 cytochrome c oxidase accessory protein CcoG [Chromatiales bacterium]